MVLIRNDLSVALGRYLSCVLVNGTKELAAPPQRASSYGARSSKTFKDAISIINLNSTIYSLFLSSSFHTSQ